MRTPSSKLFQAYRKPQRIAGNTDCGAARRAPRRKMSRIEVSMSEKLIAYYGLMYTDCPAYIAKRTGDGFVRAHLRSL